MHALLQTTLPYDACHASAPRQCAESSLGALAQIYNTQAGRSKTLAANQGAQIEDGKSKVAPALANSARQRGNALFFCAPPCTHPAMPPPKHLKTQCRVLHN
jgi:hypothetical protein